MNSHQRRFSRNLAHHQRDCLFLAPGVPELTLKTEYFKDPPTGWEVGCCKLAYPLIGIHTMNYTCEQPGTVADRPSQEGDSAFLNSAE